MKDKLEPSSNWIGKIVLPKSWNSSVRIHLLLYAIFGIAFYLLLMKHVLPEQYDVKVGTVSHETIISPITKKDENATQKAQEQAMERVENQYKKDDLLTGKQVDQIDLMFESIKKIMENTSISQEDKIKQIKDVIPKEEEYPTDFFKKLLQTTPEELNNIRLATREIIYGILNDGVKKSDLGEKRALVDRQVFQSSLEIISILDNNSKDIVKELARQSIIPNEVYDEQQTQKLKEAARDGVEPIPINKGQIIVSAGKLVTKDQYQKLEELGLLRKETTWLPYLGLATLIFTLLVLLYFYVRRFYNELSQNNMNLLMLFSILLLTLLGMKFIAIGQNLEWTKIGYLAPVGLGAMLITLLLNIELALGCVVLLAISASIFFNGENHLLFDFRYGLVAMVSGAASAFALADVRKRSSILKAGLLASAASIVPIIAIFLLVPTEGSIKDLLQSISFGIMSGIFSAVLTIGFLPYFETIFSILSPMRLIELSNPNHPLLRKLLIETPGTYHHSIIVGNLSEAAAEAVGADGLLARVGAYYHDLGKTKRPQFFIENQLHRNNPHDKISPNLSKTIIISHPRDGVELLKLHGIPKPIQDIAAQHHGTTLLKYFYYKACKQTDGAKILEEDFRYPGPKAQIKEAAIVGIADCVEAAVRSLSRPTPSRIENMVRNIIKDRLEDGQFNECDLTLKELDLIAKSMCETLQGIFHSRIEYPEEPVVKGVKHG